MYLLEQEDAIKRFLAICLGLFCILTLLKIIPLFKAGDRSLFSNYRAISLLSQFLKILEKLFNERLDKFIDKFQLLNNCQYGFRSQMSTSHALLDLVEEITPS